MPLQILSRQSILDKLESLLAEANARAGAVGVLLVRVEGLRRLTLSQGYGASDQLLAELSSMLRSISRRTDFVGRLGDQDFVYLMSPLNDESQALLCADKILRTTSDRQLFPSGIGSISLAIGIAIFPKDGQDAERLLWGADVALGMADRRTQVVCIAGEESASQAVGDLQVESLLSDAIDGGEIELHYQPKFLLSTGTLVGAEALARWDSTVIGPVSAGVFVPIAESSNLIEPLTWCCLNNALTQIAEWNNRGLEIAVAVNLSPLCLRGDEFVDRIRRSLSIWNVRPSWLTLEITESAIMDDHERCFSILRDLRAIGLRISIDDFGTGQSSFAYFKSLPADELKIDQSFIKSLASSPADRHIVRTIIDLAHRLEFDVVAEGIEDRETVGILRDMNCDVVQGYFFGRPTSAENIAQLKSQTRIERAASA